MPLRAITGRVSNPRVQGLADTMWTVTTMRLLAKNRHITHNLGSECKGLFS